jgi:hypothetical protein
MCHIANFLIKQPGKKISLTGKQEFLSTIKMVQNQVTREFLVKSLNENPGKILPYPEAF